MYSSFTVVMFIAIAAVFHITLRKRPSSEVIELNAIYHEPPVGQPTIVKPYREIALTIQDIRRTMQLATILARPDYELAKNPEKYRKILSQN